MILGRSGLTKQTAIAVASLAALSFVSVPHAAAATGSVLGFSEDPTTFGSLTSCQNVFKSSVTGDNGDGSVVARVSDVEFHFCRSGTSVAANALPWTLNLTENSSYTIKGVDVRITTPQGACRYTGQVQGLMQFPGVYSLSGQLARQSSGCGGPEQIAASNLTEVITISR
ncbi:hypothetical protein [Kribbella sp. VKM Ac-2566]|uniref:hypothetical protein n=1 Tax=Kribbella sp. VKM Ac-2566 TaxID=2512218 RepID=UPI0010628359|nr:hypothetical protein [Kribbella sp. VKM Ac-2566]TDX08261.1 hypothetical protein EV647_0533 [Kribbella sp. VKM Ac-2566]